MDELRLGTIGSSVITHEILSCVSRTQGVRLAAVYSRTQEKGWELAKKFGAEKAYTELDALLADPEVDAVYIASPNILHYEQAKRALLAGKHVICEKPFCTRAVHAQELAELARSRNLLLTEAVPTTFLPNYAVLKNSLSKIGPVKLVLGNYTQFSARYTRLLAGETLNVFDPAYAGGCLMDINYYNIYLTLALFGKPEDAVYYPNRFGNGVDTSGVVHMRYPAFTAALAASKDAQGISFFQIEGENGFISVKDGSNGLAEIRLMAGAGGEAVNLQSEPNRWLYEVQELTRLFLAEDHQALQMRMDITLAAVETVEQVRKAAGLLFPGDQ